MYTPPTYPTYMLKCQSIWSLAHRRVIPRRNFHLHQWGFAQISRVLREYIRKFFTQGLEGLAVLRGYFCIFQFYWGSGVYLCRGSDEAIPSRREKSILLFPLVPWLFNIDFEEAFLINEGCCLLPLFQNTPEGSLLPMSGHPPTG